MYTEIISSHVKSQIMAKFRNVYKINIDYRVLELEWFCYLEPISCLCINYIFEVIDNRPKDPIFKINLMS